MNSVSIALFHSILQTHSQSQSIQPVTQWCKIQGIIFQTTNIYREGIQVGFPHLVRKRAEQDCVCKDSIDLNKISVCLCVC